MKQIYSTGLTDTPAPLSGRDLNLNGDADVMLSAVSPPVRSPGAVRLALLKSPTGRVLTHVTPDCNGGYFAHTLLDVPPTADAQLAIQTWGSPLWQRRTPEQSYADLPDLPHLPVADVLDDAALATWLSTPARREAVEFVLAALLSTPSQSRVVVAAAATDVATIVYAATRALPTDLLDDFTFSTSEADPFACPARVVGFEPSSESEFPLADVPVGTVGVNLQTGHASVLPREIPFAQFATERLAASDAAALEELKSTWQRLHLKDARQFDLVYRLARGTGVLTKEEAAQALTHPPLAAWICARADARNQFLDWALDDRSFAEQSFPRAAQTLRQKSDVLTKLATITRDAGLTALAAGDLPRAETALEVVLPTVAPTKAAAVWQDVLARFPSPNALPWAARVFTLPRLVRYLDRQANAEPAGGAALAPWLAVEAHQLSELLALGLPRTHQFAAARSVLALPGEPSSLTAQVLAAHPTLALELLLPQHSTQPTPLFTALLTAAPHHPWLEEVLARAQDFPADTRNAFFEATLAAGAIDADRIIRTQGPRLLELFVGQTGLDKVGTQLLANPPADLLHAPPLLTFLNALATEPQITPALMDRISAVRTVRAYLDAPGFEPNQLQSTAAALALTPPVVPADARTETFAAVATALYRNPERPTVQTDLEAALCHFGPVLAASPVDLYENVLRELRATPDFSRHPNLVPTFLAVALGATETPGLNDKLDGLDGHAFAIAHDAARRGGSKLLAEIDRRSAEWPRPAQTQWGFLKAAVRPRGAADRLRDAGLVLAGMIAASILWGAWLALR